MATMQRCVHSACGHVTLNQLKSNIVRYSSSLAWKISDSLNNSQVADVKSKLSCHQVRVPTISTPSEVLVKVHSTSVNPLDCRMCYGYGRRVLDLLDMVTNYQVKTTNDRYPLTLGRDFSGEIVATGPCASKLYKPGDLVFGALEPQRSGAHAQYVTVPSYCVTRKPENLNHHQTASVPFVALTSYSALVTFGQLPRDRCQGKQVLVIGGSGGVGSFACQLLKLWGARVSATCATNKRSWLEEELLVEEAIDHNDPDEMASLRSRFDFVLDCGDYDRCGVGHDDMIRNSLAYLKPRTRSVYVTLSSPILKNTDEQGLVLGGSKTAVQAIRDSLVGLGDFNSARWAFFLPNKRALDYVGRLLSEGALNPMVNSVFPFQQTPEAFETLQSGSVKGKVIIDVTSAESGA